MKAKVAPGWEPSSKDVLLDYDEVTSFFILGIRIITPSRTDLEWAITRKKD